jgi:hypothetical protein
VLRPYLAGCPDARCAGYALMLNAAAIREARNLSLFANYNLTEEATSYIGRE